MANLVEIFPPADQDNRKAFFSGRTAAIQKAIRGAIRRQPKSRDQIAEEMRLLGCAVTTRMLYSWTASSRNARFPLEYLDAFCEVVGTEAVKRELLGPRLLEMLELGERAAAILDERAQRRVFQASGDGSHAREKRNGNRSCAG